MTALIDVDRLVDDLLRRRPTTPDRPPVRASGGCPAWCRLTPGHPYLAETVGGERSRYHESTALSSRELAGAGSVQARLVADEYLTAAGRRTLAPVRIVVDGPLVDGLPPLDADQARVVADLLLQAADALEGRREGRTRAA